MPHYDTIDEIRTALEQISMDLQRISKRFDDEHAKTLRYQADLITLAAMTISIVPDDPL